MRDKVTCLNLSSIWASFWRSQKKQKWLRSKLRLIDNWLRLTPRTKMYRKPFSIWKSCWPLQIRRETSRLRLMLSLSSVCFTTKKKSLRKQSNAFRSISCLLVDLRTITRLKLKEPKIDRQGQSKPRYRRSKHYDRKLQVLGAQRLEWAARLENKKINQEKLIIAGTST